MVVEEGRMHSKGTCMYLSRLSGKRDPEEDPEEGLGSWRGEIQAVGAEYYRWPARGVGSMSAGFNIRCWLRQ